MKRNFFILFLFLNTLSVFAQLKDRYKTIQEGKWILESTSAFIPGCLHDVSDTEEGHVHGQSQEVVDIEDLNMEFYTEMSVEQNSIILMSKQDTLRTKYTYSIRQGIQYEFPDFPFLSGGNVFADKLYVQQRINNHPLDSTKPVFISFVYVHKE